MTHAPIAKARAHTRGERLSRAELYRLAAALADPAVASADPDLVAANAPELVERLVVGKVPLLGFRAEQSPAHAVLMASPAFGAARDREQAHYECQRGEFAVVAEAWARAGIPYVLIKSVGQAPSYPYRSDNQDVLVPEPLGPRAAAILLEQLGYVELKNVEEPHKFLFRRFVMGREVSAIHLHEWIGWGTSFLNEAHVFQRARVAADDPLTIHPAPEEAMLTTMAHAFFENKEIKLSDLTKVTWLLRQEPHLDWELAFRLAEEKGWADGLHACILLWAGMERALYGHTTFPQERLTAADAALLPWQREDINRRLQRAPYHPRIGFVYSKRFYYAKMARDRSIGARRKLWEGLLHTTAGIRRNLHIQSQDQFLVALSGTDGSGKSTHAEALSAAFDGCHIKNRIVWSRGGSSPFTDHALRLARRFVRRGSHPNGASGPAPEATLARRRAAMRSPLLGTGWTLLVAGDLWWRYFRSVGLPLLKGDVVICDRYVYDALVELSAYADQPDPLHSRAGRLLMALSPKPDVAFWLDVAPESAAARAASPETVDFLAEQRERYAALARRGLLTPIANEGDLEQANDRLVRRALRAYYADYWTLVNQLFLFNPRRATRDRTVHSDAALAGQHQM